MKFTEAQLESAIIDLLKVEGYPYVSGRAIPGSDGAPAPSFTFGEEDAAGAASLPGVLIKSDLRAFLTKQYAADHITAQEIESVIQKLEGFSSADLYESNKAVMKMVSDGFLVKREDHTQKDLYVQLIDYSGLTEFRKPEAEQLLMVGEAQVVYNAAGATFSRNIFKVVNQLEIVGTEKRIPDGILYINGLPLVVFEFKSAIREDATVWHAYDQITNRYRRDIPALFVYNAFCVISDGVNNKAGSFFAPYEFFYAWRKTDGSDLVEKDGIDSLYSMIKGLFHQQRLLDVLRNFIYLPDTSRKEEKILCRYPQYYAATKLYQNILLHRKYPGSNGTPGSN